MSEKLPQGLRDDRSPRPHPLVGSSLAAASDVGARLRGYAATGDLRQGNTPGCGEASSKALGTIRPGVTPRASSLRRVGR